MTMNSNDALKPKPAFKATRLTATTFTVIEHSDSYGEQPLIYVKVIPEAQTVLILDTGCGGATDDSKIDVKDLRVFLETIKVSDNDGKPLNEGGKMGYVVVLSHCHYDHILGVEQFAKDSPILVSGHSPAFVDPRNLPTHSLCDSLHIDTPAFTPILVPDLHEIQSHYPREENATNQSVPLGMRILHTPGHTPDELALWEEGERVLYVGDTLYEWAPIIFPNEGSIVDWFSSVDRLIQLVGDEDANICCGHVTAGRPAKDVLLASKAFLCDVVAGREQVRKRFEKRGEVNVQYVQEGMRFSLICPERLVTEARESVEKRLSA